MLAQLELASCSFLKTQACLVSVSKELSVDKVLHHTRGKSFPALQPAHKNFHAFPNHLPLTFRGDSVDGDYFVADVIHRNSVQYLPFRTTAAAVQHVLPEASQSALPDSHVALSLHEERAASCIMRRDRRGIIPYFIKKLLH